MRGWSNFEQHINLDLSLIVKFSATICASDAVAALTIIKPHEYPKLFSIVFGEGLMNDAVAIILFKVVGSILEDSSAIGAALTEDRSTVSIVFGILGGFLANVATSLAIGTAAGTFPINIALLCTKIFQKMRFLADSPILEVVVIYLFGILSYVLA